MAAVLHLTDVLCLEVHLVFSAIRMRWTASCSACLDTCGRTCSFERVIKQ